MSNQPLLSPYPYLLNLMRNDPRANTEFNAVISTIKKPGVWEAKEQELHASIKALETHVTELQQRALKAEGGNTKAIRFIKILGERMETQLKLSPYEQDVSEKKHYDIQFSADQVRMALRWYWDVIAAGMEAALARGGPDPADEPDEFQ